jgi:hypothetical protein
MFTILGLLSHLGTYIAEFFDLVLIGLGVVLLVVSYAPAVAAGPAAALLASPVGALVRKAFRCLAIVLILLGGCRLYVAHEIAAHEASYEAAKNLAVAQAEAAALKRGAASAAAQARTQHGLEQSIAKAKEGLANAPDVNACPRDPAFDAAAAQLRRLHGSHKDAAAR